MPAKRDGVKRLAVGGPHRLAAAPLAARGPGISSPNVVASAVSVPVVVVGCWCLMVADMDRNATVASNELLVKLQWAFDTSEAHQAARGCGGAATLCSRRPHRPYWRPTSSRKAA